MILPGYCGMPTHFEDVECDLEGRFDEKNQVRYLGKAKLQPNGKWHVLAVVWGALCFVEVDLTFQASVSEA